MDTRKLLARDFCHRFCLNEAVQIWVSPQGMLKTRFNPWNQKIFDIRHYENMWEIIFSFVTAKIAALSLSPWFTSL